MNEFEFELENEVGHWATSAKTKTTNDHLKNWISNLLLNLKYFIDKPMLITVGLTCTMSYITY